MVHKQSSTASRGASWGPAAGLLAGCAVTLIGVTLDLPPLTILLRSMISGCVVAAIAGLFAFSWQLITPPREEE